MPPSYQEGSEPLWWWKVAQHLDETQLALANAMAHNVDDPRPMQALYERLRDGQAILLDIFRMKGLLPAAPNGKIEHGPPEVPLPVVPGPGTAPPGPPAVPPPDAAVSPGSGVQPRPLEANEPAVAEADQGGVAADAEPTIAPTGEPAAEPPPAPAPEPAVAAAVGSEAPVAAASEPAPPAGAGG